MNSTMLNYEQLRVRKKASTDDVNKNIGFYITFIMFKLFLLL